MMNKARNLRWILTGFLLAATLLAAGCKTASNTTTSSAIAAQNPTTTALTIYDQAPYIDTISLKSVPKLGETAEMTYTFDAVDADYLLDTPGVEDAKAWIEFWWTDPTGSYLTAEQAIKVPLSEVIVSGDTTWEGDYTKTKSLHLTSTIKLPKAGIWKIEGYFTGAGWTTPIKFYSQDFVSQNFAADMYSISFSNSSFAYLGQDYFDYGFLWNKRKIDFLNKQTDPVIMELDIAKPPKAGEEVTLTCTIASLEDVSDFSMHIDFHRRLADGATISVPASQLLINGNSQWQGNLLKAQPTVITATIKFPQEGEWEIYAGGNSQANLKLHNVGYSDTLNLTIATPTSYYGWAPFIDKPAPSTTPRPTPTAVTLTKKMAPGEENLNDD